MCPLVLIRKPYEPPTMSQDLLSFLDDSGPTAQSASASARKNSLQSEHQWQAHDSLGSSGQNSNRPSEPSTTGQPHANNGDEDDDDFGDFEDAAPPPPPVLKSTSVPGRSGAPPPVPSSTSPETPPVSQSRPAPHKAKAPTIETRSPFPPKASKSLKSVDEPKKASSLTKNNVGSHPFAGRMDLLFEADGDDYDAGADELGDLANNPEAAMEYSKRIIAEQLELAKGKGKGKATAGQRGGFVDLEEAKTHSGGGEGKQKAKDPKVLFDAEDVSDDGQDRQDEDDDFGDFETWDAPVAAAPTQSQRRPQPPTSAMDLLGLDDEAPRKRPPRSAQTRSKVEPETTPQSREGFKVVPKASKSSTSQPQEDDSWEDFETTTTTPNPARAQPPTQSQDDSWADFDDSPPPRATQPTSSKPLKPTSSQSSLPPTNIPPPIQLLTLFPPLFSSADSTLLTPLSKLDIPSRSTLLAHPATHQFLRAYLSSIAVLARIIAGRKLRWKRDQRLSQSMRIGPAAAGGKGGMKLAGLDKSEVAKEDREVLDTIRLYRAQIGKLRSAVASASAAPGVPKLPAVLEISETMPVKALKQGEGGITAREACALCGLKREERVVKLDDEGVLDSFGEWWSKDQGMHVQCLEFWGRESGKLRSR